MAVVVGQVEHVEAAQLVGVPVALGLDDHVVLVARARPQPGDAARGQPFLRDDLVEHRLRVGEQRRRAFADHLVVEDRRDSCRPAPTRGRTASSRSPRAGRPGPSRRRRGRPGWFGAGGLSAMSATNALSRAPCERQQVALPLARARDAHRLIFVGDLGDEIVADRVADQRRRDADRAAGVEHVDHRPVIGRRDAQRGVHLRRRRAADQQRHRHLRRASSPRRPSPSRRARA